MKGRKAEPIERRIAKGTVPLAPALNLPPSRVEGVPTPPPWLMEDAQAVIYWQHYSDLLFRRGQLTQDSETALVALVNCTCEWVRLARFIRESGYSQQKVTQSGDVYTAALPEASVFAECDRRLRSWLAEFGLTDASRGKVGIGAPPGAGGDDPLSAYGLQ